jgi:hypothetical protein
MGERGGGKRQQGRRERRGEKRRERKEGERRDVKRNVRTKGMMEILGKESSQLYIRHVFLHTSITF